MVTAEDKKGTTVERKAMRAKQLLFMLPSKLMVAQERLKIKRQDAFLFLMLTNT
jgi:hypothetical protein